MNNKIKESIKVMGRAVFWGLMIISGFAAIVAGVMLASSKAQACDEVYLKIGAGYKFIETDSFYVGQQEHKMEGWSPYSARIELGVSKGKWSYGISHHSQWLTGAPFNDIREYNKTEFFVDRKFSLWGL